MAMTKREFFLKYMEEVMGKVEIDDLLNWDFNTFFCKARPYLGLNVIEKVIEEEFGSNTFSPEEKIYLALLYHSPADVIDFKYKIDWINSPDRTPSKEFIKSHPFLETDTNVPPPRYVTAYYNDPDEFLADLKQPNRKENFNELIIEDKRCNFISMLKQQIALKKIACAQIVNALMRDRERRHPRISKITRYFEKLKKRQETISGFNLSAELRKVYTDPTDPKKYTAIRRRYYRWLKTQHLYYQTESRWPTREFTSFFVIMGVYWDKTITDAIHTMSFDRPSRSTIHYQSYMPLWYEVCKYSYHYRIGKDTTDIEKKYLDQLNKMKQKKLNLKITPAEADVRIKELENILAALNCDDYRKKKNWLLFFPALLPNKKCTKLYLRKEYYLGGQFLPRKALVKSLDITMSAKDYSDDLIFCSKAADSQTYHSDFGLINKKIVHLPMPKLSDLVYVMEKKDKISGLHFIFSNGGKIEAPGGKQDKDFCFLGKYDACRIMEWMLLLCLDLHESILCKKYKCNKNEIRNNYFREMLSSILENLYPAHLSGMTRAHEIEDVKKQKDLECLGKLLTQIQENFQKNFPENIKKMMNQLIMSIAEIADKKQLKQTGVS